MTLFDKYSIKQRTGVNVGERVRTSQIFDVEERTWLPRYCRGEKDCFRKLVKTYQRPIYNYLWRSGFDPDRCDDLFQDIFIKVHLAADTYKSNKPLKPWIFTIAVNTVRNYLRINVHNRCSNIDIQSIPDLASTPDKALDHKQTLAWLQHAITLLPAAQSQVIVLSTIESISHKDIASILDIPINTVKTNIRRARQKLVAGYKLINNMQPGI